MSDLDKKLSSIFEDLEGPYGFIPDTTEAVKQAFIDDGWVKLPTVSLSKGSWLDVTSATRVSRHGVALMTGQEWYDKFEKEFEEYLNSELCGLFLYSDEYEGILKAAKKAAGIK